MEQQNDSIYRQFGAWMWGALPFAVMLLDRDRRLVQQNDRAKALLSAADGLEMRNGVLVTQRADDLAGFTALLDSALDRTRRGSEPLISRLERPSGKRPYGLLAVPLEGDAGEKGVVALMVSDPDGGITIASRALQHLLDLTRMESEVAALVARGSTVPQTAEALNVKPGTVRVHLRNIFRKTGIRRQCDLAAIAVGSVGTLMPDAGRRPA